MSTIHLAILAQICHLYKTKVHSQFAKTSTKVFRERVVFENFKAKSATDFVSPNTSYLHNGENLIFALFSTF